MPIDNDTPGGSAIETTASVVDRRSNQRELRLLALDGGGIRGLSSLLILQEIMDQIRRDLHLEETPLPCNYFDLIGGTSTGGLIALLLGRLRMSVDQAIETYTSLAKDAFAKQYLLSNVYDEKKLELAIKKVAEKETGHADAPLKDPLGASCCFTFVLALQKAAPRSGPTFLRTYSAPEADPSPCSIWQAGRATTAAASFFKPVTVPIRAGGVSAELVDAGMGYNNPTEQVLDEAFRIWGEERLVGCLLSVGTGHPKAIGVGGSTRPSVLLNAAKACVSIATDCEKTHENILGSIAMSRQFRDQSTGLPSYARFNVDQGMQDVGMDEWDKVNGVISHTHNYLNKREVQVRKKQCVQNLIAIANWQLEVQDQPPAENIGSTDMLTTFNRNGRSFITQDQRQELNDILFGGLEVPGNAHLDLFDAFIFLRSFAFKRGPVDSTIKHIGYLVEFLENHGANGEIREFEDEVRRKGLPGMPEERRAHSNSWDILCTSLNFRMFEFPNHSNFLDQLNDYFQKKSEPLAFSFSLVDIARSDLLVQPTENIDEHLELNGNELKIYTIDGSRMFMLMHYSDNKVARALGISSLGDEILVSIAQLVTRDPLYREAEALGIIKFYTDADRHFTIPTALRMRRERSLKVFAARVAILDAAIRSRTASLSPAAW